MTNEPKKVRQRRSMLQIPGVQTILSSLLCIVLGLLVGFVVLLLIDHGVSEKTGNLNAVDAILVIIKNFLKYGSSTALPSSRAAIICLWMYSIAPTSKPRVGCMAISRCGERSISRATIAFCWLPPDMLRAMVVAPCPERMSYWSISRLA